LGIVIVPAGSFAPVGYLPQNVPIIQWGRTRRKTGLIKIDLLGNGPGVIRDALAAIKKTA
jgi:hypothetical protein